MKTIKPVTMDGMSWRERLILRKLIRKGLVFPSSVLEQFGDPADYPDPVLRKEAEKKTRKAALKIYNRELVRLLLASIRP